MWDINSPRKITRIVELRSVDSSFTFFRKYDVISKKTNFDFMKMDIILDIENGKIKFFFFFFIDSVESIN